MTRSMASFKRPCNQVYLLIQVGLSEQPIRISWQHIIQDSTRAVTATTVEELILRLPLKAKTVSAMIVQRKGCLDLILAVGPMRSAIEPVTFVLVPVLRDTTRDPAIMTHTSLSNASLDEA